MEAGRTNPHNVFIHLFILINIVESVPLRLQINKIIVNVGVRGGLLGRPGAVSGGASWGVLAPPGRSSN